MSLCTKYAVHFTELHKFVMWLWISFLHSITKFLVCQSFPLVIFPSFLVVVRKRLCLPTNYHNLGDKSRNSTSSPGFRHTFWLVSYKNMCVLLYWPKLLTLGAHAQRGLRYLVCVCVWVCCVCVCWHLFSHYAQQGGQKATPTATGLIFKMANYYVQKLWHEIQVKEPIC